MTNEELSAKVAGVRGDKCGRCQNTKGCTDGIGVIQYGSCLCFFEPKPYATDMNAAWELVEEMKEHDNTELVEVNIYKNNVVVQVRFKEINPTYGRFIQSEGNSVPESVCNLYLEWKSCN